ncbi:hypothetical protein ABZ128_10060 [Streptomyces sp. NPDC006326]|uniref:hypothetical protein n=1 Tax=Streptomyces sp. NPDC006326 TaxID=3156752 RepID=UPI0033BDE485
MTARVQTWAGGVVATAALVGLAVYLTVVGLDAADKWASVFGLFVGLAGLGVSVAGMRRGEPRPDGQSVDGGTVGGGIAQVSGTGGSVRITRRGTWSTSPSSTPPTQPDGVEQGSGGQRVRGATASGPIDQVQGTAGDVDIEEGP